MTAQYKAMLAAVTTGAAFLLISAPSETTAQGCGCSSPPPPPSPPAPPPSPPSPPGPSGYHHHHGGGGGGGGGGGTDINIILGGSVVVTSGASAQAGAGSSASSGSSSGANSSSNSANGPGNFNGTGGGGGGSYLAPSPVQGLQGLNVITGGQMRRTAYEASRTSIRKVVIEASCIDDRAVPHPASQATPDRDIDDAYDGELYRCIAGTHMQVTIADYDGRIAFDHGRTLDCAKGEALYHMPGKPGGADVQAGGDQAGVQNGAQLVCRAQIPARDCNERSLLRRFGAGVKILTLLTVEKYTAYREEKSSTETSTSTSLTLDGGVGGVMY